MSIDINNGQGVKTRKHTIFLQQLLILIWWWMCLLNTQKVLLCPLKKDKFKDDVLWVTRSLNPEKGNKKIFCDDMQKSMEDLIVDCRVKLWYKWSMGILLTRLFLNWLLYHRLFQRNNDNKGNYFLYQFRIV